MVEKYSRFFCQECGKWLGVSREDASISNIFPYCSRCKKAVPISKCFFREQQKESAKCRQK